MSIPLAPGESLAQRVKKGLPYAVFERLRAQLGISQAQLAKLAAIALTTLKRREADDRFTALEGDRLLRIATVWERCVELFEGDSELARRWITSPERALGGMTPLENLGTEAGAREVLDLIGRLEHGVVV